MESGDCRIVIDHYRDRKTGPGMVLVVRCTVHKIGFTLYPIGYTPYGRSKIAPISPDGKMSIGLQGADRFSCTYFDAALDAAGSNAWRHDYQDLSPTVPPFVTQSLHLKKHCTWFGINPDSDAAQREAVIQLLNVPGQVLNDHMLRISEYPGYQNRGKAICSILEILHSGPSLFERLGALGSNVGFWPPLYLWDTQHSCLRKSQFQADRTRSSPD